MHYPLSHPLWGTCFPQGALNLYSLDDVLGQVRSLQHFADSFLDEVDVNDYLGAILHLRGVEADCLYVGGNTGGWGAGPYIMPVSYTHLTLPTIYSV